MIHTIIFFLITSAFAIPPREIPPHLLSQYSMNGKAQIIKWYIDNVNSSGKEPVFTEKDFEKNFEKISKRENLHYAEDPLLHDIFQEFPGIVKGKDVFIPGSEEPVFESYALYYGAKSVLVTDYQPIKIEGPAKYNVSFQSMADFWKNPKVFDLLISFSNFEHDGLGRYGDPLNPNGDLETMKKLLAITKPGGFMILAVPYVPEQDYVVFNAHRIYGPARLPLLIKDWDLIKTWNNVTGRTDKNFAHAIMLLQNPARPKF